MSRVEAKAARQRNKTRAKIEQALALLTEAGNDPANEFEAAGAIGRACEEIRQAVRWEVHAEWKRINMARQIAEEDAAAAANATAANERLSRPMPNLVEHGA